MSCTSNFTITKGIRNEFTFTLKQTGTTLPMEIDGTDTFNASLVPLTEDGVTNSIDFVLTSEDALNGKIKLVIDANTTSSLLSEKGSKVDKYYTIPTYKLIIECNTVNNGNFVAKVPLVHVD